MKTVWLTIKKYLRFFLFSLLLTHLCLAEETYAITPPSITAYSAEYSAQINGVSLGTATYKVKNLSNNQFEIRSTANFILSKQTEISQFGWTQKNCQLEPSRYSYERNYLGKHKSYNIVFNRLQHTARWTDKNQQNTFDTPSNVQDPLTEQLAARCQVKAGESLIQLHTVRKNSVVQHTFKRINEELLSLPAGRYKTIRVEKQEPNSKKNYHTTLWFAPELNYLLVQLKHTEDNTTYTLQLKKFQSGE